MSTNPWLARFAFLTCLFVTPAFAGTVNANELRETARVISITQAEFVFSNQSQIPTSGWKQHPLPMTDFFVARTPETTSRRILWVKILVDSSELGTGAIALTTDYASERFQVYFNGRPIYRNYTDASRRNFASESPWIVPISRDDLRRGPNEIVLRLESETFWSLGLGNTKIGDDRSIRAIFDRNYLLQIKAPEFINAILAAFTLGIFCFWLARPDEESLGWLTMLGLVWFVRNIQYSTLYAPFGPDFSWEVSNNSLFVLIVVFYGFSATFFDVPRRKQLIVAIVAFGSFLMILRLYLVAIGESVIVPHLATIPLVIVLTGIFVQACLRTPTTDYFVMLGATTIAVSAFLHDFGVLAGMWQGTRFALQPYASMIVFAAFGIAMGRRVLTALDTVENLNVILEQRVATADRELRASETVRRDLQVSQAVSLERERLMMEIHDGIGSNLITALSLAEHRKASPETIATLRRSITDLKIAVDSLEPVEGDVVSLLANLRHRLEPDLNKAGLSFDWHVSDAPRLPWLDAVGALHVLRILQEAISNILAHSGARKIVVECGSAERDRRDGISITIRDAGRGFDPGSPTAGKGMANMAARAKSLHGALTCDSGVGKGTTVSLWLPLLPIQHQSGNDRP